MCGIAGIVNVEDAPPPPAERLARMGRWVAHRGPDGEGQWHAPEIGLVHRRLSIIDLEGGAQPIANEDGSVLTVFNGEIFNHVELRAELEARGHVFRTHSDTEVIVHAYETYGDAFVEHLNGQFAIALWDARRHRLLLVRDRVGILPLYWARQGPRLFFGSTLKAVLAGLDETPRLSARGLDEVLTFWAPVAPHTMFEGVSELPPGTLLRVEAGVATPHRYWDWPHRARGAHDAPVDARSEAALIDALHDVLLDATRLRLRADVPVGAYLSGGLDSTVLTSLIARRTDTPLHTFSIGFEDAGLDETPAQDRVVAALGTRHSRILCRRADVAAGFAEAVWHAESTLVRAAPVPMMRLSGLVRASGYKVVLTGEGADEVLGGYDLFKEAKIRQWWARRPASRLRPRLLSRLYPYLDVNPTRAQAYLEAFFKVGLDAPDAPLFSHLPRMATTSRCKVFLTEAARVPDGVAEATLMATLPAELPTWDPFSRAQYVECATLLRGYLLSSQGDRMLMANAIEGRFPFLDHRVIAHAAALPPHLLMRGLDEKHALKRAMRAELPPGVGARTKQPYRAPGGSAFLTGEARAETRDALAPEAVARAGLFEPAAVQRLVDKLAATEGPIGEKDNMAFLAILSTQRLHTAFVQDYPRWSRET